MRIDGSDRRSITDLGRPDPDVSPDGRKIRFKGGPDGALFVANIDGTGAVQISPSISVTYKIDDRSAVRRLGSGRDALKGILSEQPGKGAAEAAALFKRQLRDLIGRVTPQSTPAREDACRARSPGAQRAP